MEDRPTTIRIYPGELRSVYYTSVLASHSTITIEVIRLALERLQIFEDKTLYELYEGKAGEEDDWWLLGEGESPIARQENWHAKDMRFFLRRKRNASLVLQEIVSQYILPGHTTSSDIADLCLLEELSEETMLSSLNARFSVKSIYTYAGTILIAINPYYFYPIYNPKYTALYQGKSLEELPPHIFAIADRSYNSMLGDRQNQTVIISGESGAGKTESTKFLLHHLMSLSAKMDGTQSLELITLGTGPVLEAFGNARTMANNNSSRFGKFIQVQFKENGAYYGASIEKYLLEKSRIISQAQGERNYHVFYYLLAGADAPLRRQLKLLQMNQYHYLTQGSTLAPEEGLEEFHRLRQSLTMLNFSEQIQMSMFIVLSAILHIGNVVFRKKEGEDSAEIQNMETISVISQLLHVQEETLRLALTTRKSKAGGVDFFVTPYKMEEALAARDSLAKALYGSLFDWIVDQVNVSLASSFARGHTHKGNFIGVLDIFGFEVFQNNSFEQFCINYANEQLQQYFNKHIFKLEQAEYAAEGIEWSAVSFVDNQECLDLIAKKPTGLLPLLDEECSFPGADDNSLFQKFERQHKSHPHYHTPQMRHKNPVFTIVHYASDVTYSVQGFREKNRDLMRQDIIDVLRTSHMDLVRALIGLPPYAVHRWHMAFLKVTTTFAFKRAGEVHKLKKEGRLTPSFQHRLLRASTPPVTFNQHDGPAKFTQSQTYTGNLSSDAFSMDHGRLTAPGVGIRASKSYDTLSEAADHGKKRGDMVRSSSKDDGNFVTFGIGARSPRQSPDIPPEDVPDSPTFYISHASSDPSIRRQSSIDHAPHSPSPLTTEPLPPTKLKPVMSPQTASSQATNHGSQQPNMATASKLTRAPPAMKLVSQTSEALRSKIRRTSRENKQPSKQDSRSRLPSISHLQEKLKKRWPRTLRIGGSGALGEIATKEKSHKYWKTAPRMRDSDPIDPHLLHTLARTASKRYHGLSKTVSGQFQSSLIALMETLEKTTPHFVRCIKSNNQKAPCQFDEELVLRQLQYTGMVQTVKIRKSGYSVRMTFEDFYEKYQFMIGVKSYDLASQIDLFLKGMDFTPEHFQVGRTKVFMRESQKYALEEELREKVLARIVIIQRWVRAKLLRCRFLHVRRSAIVLQSAVRGWFARIKVDDMRLRVCKAVEIQAAWRGFVARKRLIRLKQATIILQAHWRGKSDRRRYATLCEERRKEEEERQRLEELRRKEEEERKKEEEQRLLEEQMKKEEERKLLEQEMKKEKERKLLAEKEMKREEQRKLLEEEMKKEEARRLLEEEAKKEEQTVNKEVVTEPADTKDEVPKPLQVQRRRDPSKRVSDGLFLDTEVSDVLFHFDTIVSELEKSTLESSTPSSLSPTEMLMRTPTPSQGREDLAPEGSTDSQGTKEDTNIRRGAIACETTPKIVQPKFRIRDIQQQFLLNAKRDSAPQLRVPDKHSGKGNVKNIVAQMQASSRETSPAAAEVEVKEPEGRQNRPRSTSITQRISMLTQTSMENDVFEKKDQVAVASRRISELTHGFETKKPTAESEFRPHSAPSQRKGRSHSLTQGDAPKVLSPPKSSHMHRRMKARENGLPSSEKPDDSMSVESRAEKPHEIVATVEKSSAEGKLSLKSEYTEHTTSGEDTHEQVHVHEDAEQAREGAPEVSDSTRQHASTSSVTSPTLLLEGEQIFVSSVEQSSSQTSIASPASLENSGEDSRTESTSSEKVLSPPVERPYRFRSISDVSHNTRLLTTYKTESYVTENMSLNPVAEPGAVSYQSLGKKKKRNVVSVADPTDIITNLQLAHIPIDESSELTQGLTAEDVRQLNQKRERMPSPAERLKLFSFTKRHLRLPFSRGKSKKEKHVKLASSPEKTSPKRKGSKHDSRNKRLSKAQADQLLCHHFIPNPIVKGVSCGVCHKGFTGFMKQCHRCADCGIVVHRHCEHRSPPCKAQIESGSYVTMSRKKVVKALDDLDDLAQFLLHKISLLNKEGTANSKVDQVFETALYELHSSLVSNYSLTLQTSLEASDQQKGAQGKSLPSSNPPPPSPEVVPRVTLTFSQLVNNFTNIFKGIAKRQGLSDPAHLAISINQMKSFLDEFTKGRRYSAVKVMSGNIEPATLRRKTFSGKDLELVDHNGHRFFTEQFKVATVCEYCNDPIPLLEKGEVCQVCGYTCHLACLKLTTGRCEGKERARSPPASKQGAAQCKNQFGVALSSLVPEGSTQVPTVLGKCLQYIEEHGLYVQGIYRKSPGASSKRAVKTTLEDDPESCSLEGFHVNAVAAAVGTFFRELPAPLLPKNLYKDLLRTVDLTDRDERLETLHHLIGRLPELNHAVFERLLFHLARVAQQESTNKMNPYNLAVIFAPCLFQAESKSKNPQDVLKDLAKQTIILELIIDEQVEKLNATLRGIETLSVVARDTASKLTELIASDETPSRKPSIRVSGGSPPVKPERASSLQSPESVKRREEEEERKRLTTELHEIERERVELTVNLPKLEPFTRDHHASWVMDSRENSPTQEKASLPSLTAHSLLPALTKNRVSQKPKSRMPTRKTLFKADHDNSDIESSQL